MDATVGTVIPSQQEAKPNPSESSISPEIVCGGSERESPRTGHSSISPSGHVHPHVSGEILVTGNLNGGGSPGQGSGINLSPSPPCSSLLPDLATRQFTPASLASTVAGMIGAGVKPGAEMVCHTPSGVPVTGVPWSLMTNSYGYGGSLLERPTHTGSPPGIPAESVHECRLIDYRGAKVAAFRVNNDYLLCLPQAFELFLKHLVGGLHTVYTKLKRLDITPIVCNVEQVRILRGLGAIQPGVNRCKLLPCKDFDTLYKDCTTARPGRPPKRASMVSMSTSPSSLMKKGRLEVDYHGYDNGLMKDHLDKTSFLHNGYNHHMVAQAVTAAAAAAVATGAPPLINTLPFMTLNHQVSHHNILPCTIASSLSVPSSHSHLQGLPQRSEGVGVKERVGHGSNIHSSNRIRDERSDLAGGKDKRHKYDSHLIKEATYFNGVATNGHSPALNLSQNSSRLGITGTNHVAGDHSGSDLTYNDFCDDDDNDTDLDEDDDRDQDYSDSADVSSTANPDRLASNQAVPFQNDVSITMGQAVFSMETLLKNIQGLLKIAADNARHQERQINLEKVELRVEISRERELRENLEKQLLEEQRTRIIYQKRLRREKRSRRKVQVQLEVEARKRTHYEDALRSSSAETLRLLNESIAEELEKERYNRTESDRKNQGNIIPECQMLL
ncbi:dachshund homolog 1-like isoform X2 [Tachypleus tridentatus]|uniref:dachshund homolog 1-like isoform X2 n=1 Tax=Tachypleus tridentatus TaxID=6853 RepID=UPI003FCEEA92